ncbi:MAG: hypothetical protein ACP5OG_04800 [Candidatus Nanoarchaeia archaeon]
MQKINKKAMTVEEVLKLFLAVIILVMLAYLGYKLYHMFAKKDTEAKAKDMLESINEKIVYLKSVEEKTTLNHTIYPIKNWYLKTLDLDSDSASEGLISKCLGQGGNQKVIVSCLCMCEDIECSSLGICINYPYEIVLDATAKEYSTFYGPDTVAKDFSNTLEFKYNLADIELLKEGDKIIISLKEEKEEKNEK